MKTTIQELREAKVTADAIVRGDLIVVGYSRLRVSRKRHVGKMVEIEVPGGSLRLAPTKLLRVLA